MTAGVRTVPRRRPRPSWRATNLAVLVALALALATGLGAVATGSARGAAVVVAHGVAGIVVVLLVPRKGRVVAGSLRRRRPSRGLSVALGVLTLGSLAFGFVSAALGGAVAGRETLWVHIALALLAVPLLAWHVVARPVRPRRADLSRRALLRAGVLAATGSALYGAAETAVRIADLPGARRRFTGSYAVDAPAALPVVSWLDDTVPDVDPAAWRLTVTDARGSRALSAAALADLGTATVRATLDCTSGWYATQDWTGVPLHRLVRAGPGHRSVRVRSLTGYDRYLPLTDLDALLLATACGGAPLTAGHGAPARLVAPGRRGFWWVKWVAGVELSRRPWWAQLPFPAT